MASAFRLAVVAFCVFTIANCLTFPVGSTAYGMGRQIPGTVGSSSIGHLPTIGHLPSIGHQNSFDRNNFFGSNGPGSFHRPTHFGSRSGDFQHSGGIGSHSGGIGSHSSQFSSFPPYGERSIVGGVGQHHMDFPYNQSPHSRHQANMHMQTLTQAPMDFSGHRGFGGPSMPSRDRNGMDGHRLESFIQNAVDRRVSSTLQGAFKRDGFGNGNGHMSDGFSSGIGGQRRPGSQGHQAMHGLPAAVMGFGPDNLKMRDSSFLDVPPYGEPSRMTVGMPSSGLSRNHFGFNDPHYGGGRREIFV